VRGSTTSRHSVTCTPLKWTLIIFSFTLTTSLSLQI
jgi:hypothetical protein